MNNMIALNLVIQFHTPSFLGDATQSARWRTPPFKAQLRQWWRVAYAASQQHRVNLKEMRELEAHLFGHAWLDDDRDDAGNKVAARKSLVRLRLSRWDEGKMRQWPTPDPAVRHPNVHGRDGRERPVGAQLYMGYGPLVFRQGTGTALKANAAIQAGESAELAIAYPEAHAPQIEHALWLMDHYGTVGGRSRNGWGSYTLTDVQAPAQPARHTQPLTECLRLDWPHALAGDSGSALVWQTQAHSDWASLMKTLAQIKIAMRTQFVFKTGKTPTPEDRHWLSYPVTNHSVTNWGNNARLPNQLRFKVRPTANGQVLGVIFHLPHQPPAAFEPQPATLERIWQDVHQHLDATPNLTRIKA